MPSRKTGVRGRIGACHRSAVRPFYPREARNRLHLAAESSLDVNSLRSISLFIAPVVSFATVAWVVLCLLFGFPGQEQKATSVALLGFASAGVCAYTTGRLYPRRSTPDFRAPFLLNAAGLAAILSWIALSYFSAMWQHLMHRAA